MALPIMISRLSREKVYWCFCVALEGGDYRIGGMALDINSNTLVVLAGGRRLESDILLVL